MAIRWKSKATEAAEHAKSLEKLDTIIKQRDDALALAERAVEAAEGRSGRPHSGKQVVSIRLDPDVVEKFRATGKGWQARMNEALRKAMP